MYVCIIIWEGVGRRSLVQYEYEYVTSCAQMKREAQRREARRVQDAEFDAHEQRQRAKAEELEELRAVAAVQTAEEAAREQSDARRCERAPRTSKHL